MKYLGILAGVAALAFTATLAWLLYGIDRAIRTAWRG